MNPLLVSAFGTALVAILGFCVYIVKTLGEQAKQIAILETQISPLWAVVQAKISKTLHHPHPRYFEMDKLLEELDNLTITTAGRTRLKTLLLERASDMHPDITEEQRMSARALIPVMDLVEIEEHRK